MQRTRSSIYGVLALFLLVTGCANLPPATSVEIEEGVTSFAPVARAVDSLTDRYGAQNVLVVLDIDNTLLTSTSDLGGDIWYQWQRGRLDIQPGEAQQVECLFEDAIGLLYELAPMQLTDPAIPKAIIDWQDRGNVVFALTSRSPKYRAATERELLRAGIDLSRNPPAPEGRSAPVLRERAEQEWSYMQGIMMTTGMNKGTMLETLLEKTGRNFPAVVFVDDTRRHVIDVSEAYRATAGVDLHVFHYTKVEEERKHTFGQVLTEDQAAKMASDWSQLNQVLEAIYPARKLPEGCLGR